MTLAQFLHETYPWTGICIGLIVGIAIAMWLDNRDGK